MASRITNSVRESLQDLVDAGLSTKPFTNKRLKQLGVELPTIKMNPKKIQRIRKSTHLSQAVFAKLLNVSLASIQHWEQGIRQPSGSTKVLLELLNKNPHALDDFLPKVLRVA
jgi:putative transcriptional regulator